MKLTGIAYQGDRHFSYDASGTIASASLPQLVLPENPARSSLFLQNTSNALQWYGFGAGRATCTISGGVVNATTIVNGGFGFTRTPAVSFLGGGILPGYGVQGPNTSYVGGSGANFPSPAHPATGHAVLTAGKITSIVIDDPGVGYVIAPYVFISNDALDPNGAFDPSVGSGAGFQLYPGQSIYEAHSVVTTDALSMFCATLSSTFACRWTP